MMTNALKKFHDRENGFTLIELLIVVLIIGILAAIAIPVYLGIQAQGYKSAVKADVNITVKRVQVALTEGSTMTSIRGNQAPYTKTSVKGEVVEIRTSSNASAGADDYGVQGIVTKNAGGPVNYGYFYDSVTGKFTESDDAVALGSSASSIAITTGSLPNASAGTAYSATVNATTVNPAGATKFTATGLPTGWNLDQNTGIITAPASAVTSGDQIFTVTATNGAVSSTKTYTVSVTATPTVTQTSLPNPTLGAAYSQTLTATGYPNSGFTYALTSGTLPAGLQLSAAGVISGTPTATGAFSFSIAASNSAGQGASNSYAVVVGSVPTIAGSTSSATTLWPGFTHDAAYLASEQPVTTGYPSPTISATGLPSGLSINSSTGAISGVSTASAGTYNVTLTATNSYGTGTQAATMTIVNSVNAYSQVVDEVKSLSSGSITFTGWAVAQSAANQGGYTASGDRSKATLRVDVHIDNVAYDFNTTNISRADVNAAFGGGIGNLHGYRFTLPASAGSHSVQIYLRDGNSANGFQQVYNGTVTVN